MRWPPARSPAAVVTAHLSGLASRLITALYTRDRFLACRITHPPEASNFLDHLSANKEFRDAIIGQLIRQFLNPARNPRFQEVAGYWYRRSNAINATLGRYPLSGATVPGGLPETQDIEFTVPDLPDVHFVHSGREEGGWSDDGSRAVFEEGSREHFVLEPFGDFLGFVYNEEARAGLGYAHHLAQCGFRIGEEVDAADVIDAIER